MKHASSRKLKCCRGVTLNYTIPCVLKQWIKRIFAKYLQFNWVSFYAIFMLMACRSGTTAACWWHGSSWPRTNAESTGGRESQTRSHWHAEGKPVSLSKCQYHIYCTLIIASLPVVCKTDCLFWCFLPIHVGTYMAVPFLSTETVPEAGSVYCIDQQVPKDVLSSSLSFLSHNAEPLLSIYWVSDWSPSPTWHITGHVGDESFQKLIALVRKTTLAATEKKITEKQIKNINIGINVNQMFINVHSCGNAVQYRTAQIIFCCLLWLPSFNTVLHNIIVISSWSWSVSFSNITRHLNIKLPNLTLILVC